MLRSSRFFLPLYLALLLPFSALGQITFERTYGGAQNDLAYTVCQTADAGYVIVGGTNSFGAGQRDFYLVKTDSSGNMVWTVDTDFGQLCASEDYDTHSDSGGDTDALTVDDLECIDISAALTNIAGGDLVGVDFMRDGDDASDTIGDSVYYLGLRMRYL